MSWGRRSAQLLAGLADVGSLAPRKRWSRVGKEGKMSVELVKHNIHWMKSLDEVIVCFSMISIPTM